MHRVLVVAEVKIAGVSAATAATVALVLSNGQLRRRGRMVVIKVRRWNLVLSYNDACAYRHPRVEIDHVVINQAEAAR